jgi:dynein heavy chain
VIRHIEIATEVVKGELDNNGRTSIYNFIVNRI